MTVRLHFVTPVKTLLTVTKPLVDTYCQQAPRAQRWDRTRISQCHTWKLYCPIQNTFLIFINYRFLQRIRASRVCTDVLSRGIGSHAEAESRRDLQAWGCGGAGAVQFKGEGPNTRMTGGRAAGPAQIPLHLGPSQPPRARWGPALVGEASQRESHLETSQTPGNNIQPTDWALCGLISLAYS